MINYKTAKIIRTSLMALIVIVAVVAIITIIQTVAGNVSQKQVDTSSQSLISTDANMSVSMAVRGNIVGNDEFRSYKITITPSKRTLTIYQGYLGTVIKNIELTNNVAAYKEFVHALSLAGLAKGTQSNKENDSTGACATGYLYEFQIKKGDDNIKKLWSSSCSSPKGTLSGNYKSYRTLFIAQITDGQSIINGIW